MESEEKWGLLKMGAIIDNIKYRLKERDILVWLIIINICVFLVLAILKLVTTLFMFDSFDVIRFIGVPDRLTPLLYRPWTIITYMFAHEGFLHILFNMLMLFWFGQMFLKDFSPRNLGSLYLLGGLSGALFYLLAFNVIPFYREFHPSYMIGASASVMAIIFAAAFYNPNLKMNLLLLGPVKIIYIAIFLFILDFVSLADPRNPGGHVAHIGGAILGYVYAKQYLKGRDITRWVTRMMDWFSNLTKPRPKKAKVKYNNERQADYESNKRKHEEVRKIDEILDKIKKSGYSSLSDNEKKRLFDASKK